MNETVYKPRILIVDDEPANIKILGELLKDNYRIIMAKNGPDALERARDKEPPDIVLLDVVMPGMDGYEVCKELKSDLRTRDIPVIFVTAMSEEEHEIKGFELGAVDYISKPFRPAVIKARVKTHIELKRFRDYLQEMIETRTDEMFSHLSRYEDLVRALPRGKNG